MALLGVSGLVAGLGLDGPGLVEVTFPGPGLVGLRRGPLVKGPGETALRGLKVNFWLGLVGVVLGVTFPEPGSLLPAEAGEVVTISFLRPGLELEAALVRFGFSGDTMPWTVLDTRAETVTRLRSAEMGRLCGLAEVVELSGETSEMVTVRRGFVPFSDTTGGVSGESVEVSPFSLTPGDVAAREVDFVLSESDGVEVPGWTGGRGARYLTLAECDRGEMDGGSGEDCFAADAVDGIGGAGALIDLGLGVRGLGGDDPPEA